MILRKEIIAIFTFVFEGVENAFLKFFYILGCFKGFRLVFFQKLIQGKYLIFVLKI